MRCVRVFITLSPYHLVMAILICSLGDICGPTVSVCMLRCLAPQFSRNQRCRALLDELLAQLCHVCSCWVCTHEGNCATVQVIRLWWICCVKKCIAFLHLFVLILTWAINGAAAVFCCPQLPSVAVCGSSLQPGVLLRDVVQASGLRLGCGAASCGGGEDGKEEGLTVSHPL